MCVNVKMNGLSKLGSHSDGHHNQSDGLVWSEKPWVCRRDRKWTRGKHPVREKRRSNQSGGGRYAGNDSAVRQTYSGMIAGDVDQRAGGDSSPLCHKFRRDSNPPAKSRMALHSFIPNLFAAKYASAISWGCYSESSTCSNVLLLHRRPKTTKALSRTRARLLQEVALQEAPRYGGNWTVHVKRWQVWNEVSLNIVLPCNWFERWWSRRIKGVENRELQCVHAFASIVLSLQEDCRCSVYAGFSTGFSA